MSHVRLPISASPAHADSVRTDSAHASSHHTNPVSASPTGAEAGAPSPLPYASLAGTPLFRDVKPDEAQAMLVCLDARRRTYQQGEFVLREGDRVRAVGVVLSGSVTIERTDVWGSRSIMGRSAFGETFAEAYACTPAAICGVDVVAAQPGTEVLFVNVDRALNMCQSSCSFHAALVRNLLGAIASKNLQLNRKIIDITPRTIRARALSYLSGQARQAGSRRFTIPFNRQQLADYLCVDRSALCHELARMREEGVIDYDRNDFELSGASVVEL